MMQNSQTSTTEEVAEYGVNWGGVFVSTFIVIMILLAIAEGSSSGSDTELLMGFFKVAAAIIGLLWALLPLLAWLEIRKLRRELNKAGFLRSSAPPASQSNRGEARAVYEIKEPKEMK